MRPLRKLGRDLVNVVFYLMIAVLILTGNNFTDAIIKGTCRLLSK